jgi:glucose-1-phosphate cytidylyltransferase
MKVVILAGGLGTRLAEETNIIPKPMVQIGGKPILCHIMGHYAHYGHQDFYLATGYKSNMIKEYFLNYSTLCSDFTINMKTGHVEKINEPGLDWRVTIADTGLHTMTGGRLKRMKDHIQGETFFLTYGDGLSDIDINSLFAFHKSHGKMVTVTAVHPVARFGEIQIGDNGAVSSFQEKPQVETGRINGGFFVIEPEFLDYIDGDDVIMEKDVLNKITELGQLMAYRHDGFWHCMDTIREKNVLNQLWETQKAPWKQV